MKFNGEEGGVENDFGKYWDRGGGGSDWWDDEPDGGSGSIGGIGASKLGGKMPQSLSEFEDLRLAISKLIFGV